VQIVFFVGSFLLAWWLVVAFSFWWRCGLLSFHLWQDIARRRTRSGLAKADKRQIKYICTNKAVLLPF
jgi:hypothetical protein